MKNDSQKITLLVALGLTAMQLPAIACGPFFDDPAFFYDRHPDMPLSLYASGKLGIIKPEFARSYLVVAWRYFNNKALSAAEQKSIVALWDQRLDSEAKDLDNAIKKWQSTLKQYDKAGKYDDVYPTRDYNGKGDVWFSYTNCPADAFNFASQTAKSIADSFGVDSKEIKNWVKSQYQVFCNCSGGMGDSKPQIPAAITAELSTKLKPYRDYQIASANFYANNFDKAIEQFETISADKTSPFQNLASYLAVRAMVRKATVADKNDEALLARAEKRLHDLQNDKAMSSMKNQLGDLLGFVKFKLGGPSRFAELAKALSTSNEGAEAGNNLCDYTFLFDKMLGESADMPEDDAASAKQRWTKADPIVKSDELSEWVLTFQSAGADAYQHALKRWKDGKKVQWLIAALSLADPKSAEINELLSEAEKVDSNSTAYLQLQYQVASLNLKQGNKDAVAARVDKLFANSALKIPPSSRNRLSDLRMLVSKSFPEYLRYAFERPTAIESGWDGVELPVDFQKVEALKDYQVLEPAFNNDSTTFLNSSVPLSLLSTIPNTPSISAKLRADSLQSLWVRSFILKDSRSLSNITPKLKTAIPSLSPLLSNYEKASSAEEKTFAGSLMILKNPGMRPALSMAYGRRTPIDKIDDYQDNWWSANDFAAPIDAAKLKINAQMSAVLSASEKAAAAAETAKLIANGTPTVYLGQNAISWAKSHPQDPRVPEALALTVKASKFADRNEATSKISKDAFTLLHSKYPKNPWTAKTKYYY